MPRAVLGLALALAVATTTVPSTAGHGPGCGWEYRSPIDTSCAFALRALPLTVFGTAETPSGTASIYVAIGVATPAGMQILVECAASGPRFAQCDGSLGVGENIDTFVQSANLECIVRGSRTGDFWCESYIP